MKKLLVLWIAAVLFVPATVFGGVSVLRGPETALLDFRTDDTGAWMSDHWADTLFLIIDADAPLGGEDDYTINHVAYIAKWKYRGPGGMVKEYERGELTDDFHLVDLGFNNRRVAAVVYTEEDGGEGRRGVASFRGKRKVNYLVKELEGFTCSFGYVGAIDNPDPSRIAATLIQLKRTTVFDGLADNGPDMADAIVQNLENRGYEEWTP